MKFEDDGRIFCIECHKEGKKSKVYEGHCETTLLYVIPFYDESGDRHIHDKNFIYQNFRCENGHFFKKTEKPKCWCGWPDI